MVLRTRGSDCIWKLSDDASADLLYYGGSACPSFGGDKEELDPLEDISAPIKEAIAEEPPLAMKEGGIIRDGYSEEVDILRRAKSEGKDWLAKLESEEREKTGIKI